VDCCKPRVAGSHSVFAIAFKVVEEASDQRGIDVGYFQITRLPMELLFGVYCNVNWTFLKLVDLAGLRSGSASRRPRLHDLRHSFALHTLLDWYNAGVDVQSRLPLLSTYLGHVNPGATYWYLSAAPDLMILASNRLEKAPGGQS
jgi:integrase